MAIAKHAFQGVHRRSVRTLGASSPSRLCRCHAAKDSATPSSGAVDIEFMGKIAGATVAQAGILCTGLVGLDKIMHLDAFPSGGIVPTAAVWLLFAFLSYKSKVLSFLDASRPYQKTREDGKSVGYGDRKLPSWTPPAYAFGIIWASITVLRATSAVMIWQAAGQSLAVVPLLVFVVHLSIGDTWNYINNACSEKGFSSVVNTLFVWPSAWAVIYFYYQTNPTAGLTLAPMGVWLTVAMVLVWSIWDLNGREPLLPVKEE